MTYRIRKKSGLLIPKTPKLIIPGHLPEMPGTELTDRIIQEEINIFLFLSNIYDFSLPNLI